MALQDLQISESSVKAKTAKQLNDSFDASKKIENDPNKEKVTIKNKAFTCFFYFRPH